MEDWSDTAGKGEGWGGTDKNGERPYRKRHGRLAYEGAALWIATFTVTFLSDSWIP
jgi:hypothetical protein